MIEGTEDTTMIVTMMMIMTATTHTIRTIHAAPADVAEEAVDTEKTRRQDGLDHWAQFIDFLMLHLVSSQCSFKVNNEFLKTSNSNLYYDTNV